MQVGMRQWLCVGLAALALGFTVPATAADAGAEQDQARAGAQPRTGEDAGDAAILHRQFDGVKAFQQGDAVGCGRALRQGGRNRRARAVAFDMHDARQGVRRFAAQR